MTGILFADYFVVRNRTLHLSDLYVGNSASAYWYTAGFNWRPIIAWYVSAPLTPSPTVAPPPPFHENSPLAKIFSCS